MLSEIKSDSTMFAHCTIRWTIGPFHHLRHIIKINNNLQIYGYDKPKPVIKKLSFKEELMSLTQKARQKETDDS